MWLCFLVKKERLISCATESPVASKQYVTGHCTTASNYFKCVTSAPCIFQEFRGVCPILSKHFFEKYTFAKSCWQVKHKKKQLVRHGVPGQCMSSTCNIDSNKIIGIGASFIIIIIIIIIIIMIILFVH